MAEHEPEPGDVLGDRYEILGELGRGGMATVYRGRDLRLERTVAVKVFRAGFAEAVDPRRIAQEMHLLAGVDHPCVVSVLDASRGDGRFGTFLVMELVRGDDLGALLHRARGPLAADFARRIVADVAGALAALHRRSIVHRDVKPGNILVPAAALTHAAQVTAKLTDFGIAQLVDDAGLTGPDSILGTAAYLSPEQVRGGRPLPASDVYALGLVLLEALTGRRAFPGAAAEAAMARLTRPPALPTDASPALADLLSRMTALDPDHRPAAAEVAEALREQLAGRVTAPDAVQTAPTPIAGLTIAAAAPEEPDATAPHDPLWTPGGGIAMPVTARTGVPVPTRQAGRRRFPTALVVAASVLAAAVAGVAISAASGVAPSRSPHAGSGPVASVGADLPGTVPGAADPSEAPVVHIGGSTGRTPATSPTPGASGSATPRPEPTPTPTATPAPGVPQPAPTDPAPPSSTPTADPPSTDPPTVDPPSADPTTPPVQDPTSDPAPTPSDSSDPGDPGTPDAILAAQPPVPA